MTSPKPQLSWDIGTKMDVEVCEVKEREASESLVRELLIAFAVISPHKHVHR